MFFRVGKFVSSCGRALRVKREALRQELDVSTGQPSLPYVWINGRCIGGTYQTQRPLKNGHMLQQFQIKTFRKQNQDIQHNIIVILTSSSKPVLFGAVDPHRCGSLLLHGHPEQKPRFAARAIIGEAKHC
jgi:hypothetical protein